MENYKRILGQNLRKAREALQLSQEELAHEIDIDRTYISGIERGVRNPSLDVIAKIAQRLKTTPAALLTRPAQSRRSESA
ncbi:helix-turn-helix domain-containing protein [Microvirga calopogonii]|uniref:helix-turn-helix domain-containing protein n=1 Tax=Microvirga calopogonii TaxID=2078013 RepID=UPI001478157B|nr:helix-turn-helix transcriptional regulator [Microvirga calopogonii]